MEILNPVDHTDIRLLPGMTEAFDSAEQMCPVVPSEFGSAFREFPIFITKNQETGQFEFKLLVGLDQGENLFLNGDAWSASYLPLHYGRLPFSIGLQRLKGKAPQRVITFDPESTLISLSEGDRIFTPDGQPTERLNHVNTILAELYEGVEQSKSLIETLIQHDLIEPVDVRIELEDREPLIFEGLYSVSEERLGSLDEQVGNEFERRGVLRAIQLMQDSLTQLDNLIRRKTLKEVASSQSNRQ